MSYHDTSYVSGTWKWAPTTMPGNMMLYMFHRVPHNTQMKQQQKHRTKQVHLTTCAWVVLMIFCASTVPPDSMLPLTEARKSLMLKKFLEAGT